MSDQDYQREILQRLTRVEEKIDNISELKEKAYDANRRSIDNKEKIEKIEARFIRIWAAIWSLITVVIGASIGALVNYFLGGGKG